MIRLNANLGGLFASSIAAEAMIENPASATADLVRAGAGRGGVRPEHDDAHLRPLAGDRRRELAAGDEILLTRMEHDANVAPWLMLARGEGPHRPLARFRSDHLRVRPLHAGRPGHRSLKLAAIGQASNLTGTINDVSAIAARVKAAGALVFVDAVQYAPHAAMDVAAPGARFRRLLRLQAIRAAPGRAVGSTRGAGALDRVAGAAGARGAARKVRDRHLEPRGDRRVSGRDRAPAMARRAFGHAPPSASAREQLLAGFEAIAAHEGALTRRLIEGLGAIGGVVDPGPERDPDTRPARADRLLHSSAPWPRAICARWPRRISGCGTATTTPSSRSLASGLMDKGGVVRVGLAQYNTADEVDRLLERLDGAPRMKADARLADRRPG